ncbi:uncharacterized protein BDZ83DRAFT_758567 [Colletotrichum acutatum]|uniref:Uncharacterized protein n=1 Tax=Glomerella acutata TaxID=27357 RepID=A0AAD8U9U7_GLOAC|nr:uncharacterized protein BDZ83DRAFT_758567 [Colletotrichum acutatum]KAK1705627.1 hypothetical protein BDZ83DRAFT_758567 [Colletotrichum acutatum]
MHRAKQFFAVLGRSTGLKKAEPEHDTDIDTKDDTKVERKADSRTRYRDFETQTSPDPKPPTLTEKGWTFRREAEFLWRLEQVVDQEENWRGTCMPEVKDMRAMDWGTELVPKEMGSLTTNAMQGLSSRIVDAVTSNPAVSLLYIALTTILVLFLWTKTTRRTSGLPLPPQPPSKPILGHLTDLIRENRARRWHLKLEGWAREYGAIFGVRTGYIVDYYINSDLLVKELFDKKSAVTADRPVWIMSNY